MGKAYTVESDFDDLHGNPDEGIDLDIDLSDSDNPIIKAALNDNEDYQPPEEDSDKDDDQDDKTFDDDDEDDDTLDEMDDDDGDADKDDDEDEDEDSDSDEDDDEDEEDDDDKSYSKNVQKRIDRERDARRADRVASDKRVAKLEKRLELSDAKETFRDEQADADKKLQSLRKKKTAALDDDDTEAVVDIDDKILDIKADRKAKQMELERLKEDIKNEPEDTDTGTPAAGVEWLKKYPQFHTNAQFKRTVLQADKMVSGRNFDRETEEYYKEIEKILAPQFPEIVKIAKKTTKRKKTQQTARKKKRSAVGSTTKAGTRRSKSRRGMIRLTKVDQQQMEVFGMDPKNPADIKAWADSKGSS